MSSLELGFIGNCCVSALIDRRGRMVWSCLPRFDSDPTFCALLDGSDTPERGFFDLELLDLAETEQYYVPNTAILVTVLRDGAGNAVEITDFAPRFKQFGRTYRPMLFARQVRPLAGSPRIRVRLRPAYDYGAGRPSVTSGSNHIRYVMPSLTVRLVTDASLTAVLDETPFVLEGEHCFLLGQDETLNSSIADTGRRFFEQTRDYWRQWVRYLAIPFEWQGAVIRAAITLKLSNYEDTGAVVAAMTTSIPEAPDSGRNWDYRYCWVRDAYFVVGALNRLGATKTMEDFLYYIINLAGNARDGRLQPVYLINGRPELDESVIGHLAGYRGMGPVRVGNQAYTQAQHDVYGAAVMAATHIFFDQRLERPGEEALFRQLERLGALAAELYDQPDAGLWELRNSTQVHTFSSVMCWAACDRLARIATRLGLSERHAHWRALADRMHQTISERAWNPDLESFVESFGGEHLDASLLLLHELGFLRADDPRFASTVRAVEKYLRRGDFLFRYAKADDFGIPRTAFLVCTFWYINALADLDRRDEARELFERLLACRNRHGLFSEDIDPITKELWGNYPQTYSMVGLINCAMRLSEPWEEAF